MESHSPLDLSDDLVERSLAGQLTAQEAEVVKRALRERPIAEQTLARMMSIMRGTRLNALETSEQVCPRDARVRALVAERTGGHFPGQSSQLGAREPQAPRLHVPAQRGRWGRWALAMAGAAAMLVAVGALVRETMGPSHATQRYATEMGQRSTIRLADGSTILLAPATTVIVTPTTIDVTGEAYFNIASHASHPTTVRTTQAVVNVLGTAFTVRQYAHESRARVVVQDGKVSVRPRHAGAEIGTPMVLTPRMMAYVTDSTVAVTSDASMREYTSWTRGLLVFDRTPLRDVAVELSRAYGADIRVADSVLADKTVIADVEVLRQPLPAVLDIITTILDAHYRRDGAAYVLSPGRGAVKVPRGQQFHDIPQPEKQYGR